MNDRAHTCKFKPVGTAGGLLTDGTAGPRSELRLVIVVVAATEALVAAKTTVRKSERLIMGAAQGP